MVNTEGDNEWHSCLSLVRVSMHPRRGTIPPDYGLVPVATKAPPKLQHQKQLGQRASYPT